MTNQELKLRTQTLKVMTDALSLKINKRDIEVILELEEMHKENENISVSTLRKYGIEKQLIPD